MNLKESAHGLEEYRLEIDGNVLRRRLRLTLMINTAWGRVQK